MGGDRHEVTHTEEPAEMYDATGAVWLEGFGEHVHVGFYPDRESFKTLSWRQAQYDHVAQIMNFAGMKSTKKLLDIGCGYGGTAVHIVKQLGCSAIGINVSSFQVNAGNELAARSGLSPEQAKFMVADGMAPPFPDASFDVVLSVEASTYMPDKSRFIAEMARLCTPGGKVVLVDFHRTSSGPKTPEQARILHKMYTWFSTQGEWAAPEQHKQLMAEHGLQVVAAADWTQHVRAFWSVGVFEMLQLWGKDHPGVFSKVFVCLKKLIYLTWLVLVGGLAAFKLCWLWVTGVQKRTAERGMANGAFGYYIIVAEKPLDWAPAASKAKAALPSGNEISLVVQA